VDETPQKTPVEPPRGFFSAHVDDKGRLKLPVELQQYLGEFGGEKFFVTSMDRLIARIYPISVWKENEKVLAALSKEDPEAADALLFMANDCGAEAKLDAQGRMILPTDLRRALAVEGQEVRLDCSQDGVNLYPMGEYERRRERYRGVAPEKLLVAKLKGLK
jgi:MraZ protein